MPHLQETGMKLFLLLACVLLVHFLEARNAETETLIRAEYERKAGIFHVVAKCMSEPAVIRVGNDPVAECKPWRAK